MNSNSVLIVGAKETFIIRVLLKKLSEAEINVKFVTSSVNDIASVITRDSLVVFYLEKDEQISSDVRAFVTDQINDIGGKIVIIADRHELDEASALFSTGIVFRTMLRPLDYDSFISSIKEYEKLSADDGLKKSILIVDDDPNYMNIVREWLKDTYKLSMATSGLRAIKWLATNRVDLILLDYEMPVTDGPQVLEMLRADDDTKEIPVIFLTGRDDKHSVMKVLDLKPQGYFLKSVGKEELLGKLKNFFMSI